MPTVIVPNNSNRPTGYRYMPTREIESISATNIYSTLQQNLFSRGLSQAHQYFRDQHQRIDDLSIGMRTAYPFKDFAGAMEMQVNDTDTLDIWLMKFQGTELIDSIVPQNPLLLTIAHETMLGGRLPIQPDPHPAIRGMHSTYAEHFAKIQKASRESRRKGL